MANQRRKARSEQPKATVKEIVDTVLQQQGQRGGAPGGAPTLLTSPEVLAIHFDLPDREEVVELFDIYKGHSVTFRTNVPDKEVVGRPILDVVADNIIRWTFRARPTEAQKAKGEKGDPILPSPAALMALPPDLHNYLINEFNARREVPLALRAPSENSESSPMPTELNGHSPQTPMPSQ